MFAAWVWLGLSTLLILSHQQKSTITVPGEGILADIYQLYDIRTGDILPINIGTSGSKSFLQLIRHGVTTSKKSIIRSSTDYLDDVQMSGDVQINLLLGIFGGGISGGGGFRKLKKTLARKAAGKLQMQEGNWLEKVDMCNPSLIPFIKTNYFNDSAINATHVIVERQFGLDLEITFESLDQEEDDTPQKLEAKLNADMQFPMVSVGGGGEISNVHQNRSNTSEYKIKVNSNIPLLYYFPSQYDEIVPLLQKLPELVNKTEGSKGGIISYEVLDINYIIQCHHLEMKHDEIIRITQQNLILIKSTLSRLETYSQQINDVINDIYKFSVCVPPYIISQINKFKMSYDKHTITFTNELKEKILNVRYGSENETSLVTFVEKYSNNEHSGENALYLLKYNYSSWIKKINFYKTVGTKGIKCLKPDDSINELFTNKYDKRFMFFMFTAREITQSPNFLTTSHVFITDCATCKNSCECYAVDCEIGFDACEGHEDVELRHYVHGSYNIIEFSELIKTLRSTIQEEEDNQTKIVNANVYVYKLSVALRQLIFELEEKTITYISEIQNFLKTKNTGLTKFSTPTHLFKIFNDSVITNFVNFNQTDLNPVDLLFNDFVDY